jgi:hypothetical protein
MRQGTASRRLKLVGARESRRLAAQRATARRAQVKISFRNATTDPRVIRDWWQRWPNTLIGMPAGAVSNLAILSVSASYGFAALPNCVDLSPLVVATPDGFEIYFRADGAPCSGKLWPGIEVKAEGAYVILPPSRGYRWAKGSLLVTDRNSLPPWPRQLSIGTKRAT